MHARAAHACAALPHALHGAACACMHPGAAPCDEQQAERTAHASEVPGVEGRLNAQVLHGADAAQRHDPGE